MGCTGTRAAEAARRSAGLACGVTGRECGRGGGGGGVRRTPGGVIVPGRSAGLLAMMASRGTGGWRCVELVALAAVGDTSAIVQSREGRTGVLPLGGLGLGLWSRAESLVRYDALF